MLSILHSLDIFILELVNLSYHNYILDNLALLLTNMGVIYFWIIIMIMLYLFSDKGKKIAKKMLIVLVITVLLTQLMKFVIIRPRPYTELSSLVVLSLGTDPSFPSGHTATSTAMSYLISKEYNVLGILLIPLIVAVSRLYLGVHYPSDVIGGFLVGFVVVYVVENYLKFLIV